MKRKSRATYYDVVVSYHHLTASTEKKPGEKTNPDIAYDDPAGHWSVSTNTFSADQSATSSKGEGKFNV